MLTWLALLQIGLATSDSTPIRPILQLVHTKWTAKDGAPVEVTALAQTADGYLWIGAWAGLFRFDGVRFVPFVPRQGDVQPGRGVSQLFAARDGSLWIIWGSTLSRLLNGRLRSFGPQNGFPGFRGVSESSTGTLVAATERGLFRFSDGTWKGRGPALRLPPDRNQYHLRSEADPARGHGRRSGVQARPGRGGQPQWALRLERHAGARRASGRPLRDPRPARRRNRADPGTAVARDPYHRPIDRSPRFPYHRSDGSRRHHLDERHGRSA